MINQKIALSALSIVTALALTGGATFAFFTANAQSTGNTFATGSMSVSITDQNADTAFINKQLATNWQPGEQSLVAFDVKNTGTLPVQLRGFATGTWGVSALDTQNKVKVTKVERWDGAAWQTLREDTNGLTGYFYFSNNGQDNGSFFDVLPGGRAQFQLTVVLDGTAGTDFQNNTFTSAINVEARQTTAGATWPTP